MANVKTAKKKTSTRASGKKKAPAKTTAKAPATSKKLTGILDAAAQILAKSKKPMACKAITDQAIADGLWTSSGKTPQATLYAAIIREIDKKGKDSRFKKIDRGLFALKG